MAAPSGNRYNKKYKNAGVLQRAINSYFAKRDAEEKPYTFLSLALHIGISKETALSYLSDKDLGSTMREAKARCEAYAEDRLYSGGNTRGIEFALRYAYGWRDEPQVGALGQDAERKPFSPHSTLDLLAGYHSNFIVKKFHRWLCSELDAFAARFHSGLAPRLHITLPPRHSKTTSVEGLVARMLGNDPSLNIAWISYNSQLAERSSRAIKSIIESDPYKAAFGDIKGPSRRWGATEWRTSAGGGLIARGFQSGVEGHNIDIIVPDDLCKEYAAYLSLAFREKYDLFFDTLTSRLENTTGIVSIGRRWGIDDPIDKMQKALPGPWANLWLPAIALDNDPLGRLPGEPLFPERVNLELLESIRDTLGEIEFNAFYQGQPIDSAGKIFKIEMFQFDQHMPAGLQLYRMWDLGFTDDKKQCPSASVLGGVDSRGDLWIKHMIVDHGEWPRIKELIKTQRKADPPNTLTYVEANGTQKGYTQELNKESGAGTFYPRNSKYDKMTEARLWQSIQWSGKVHFVKDPDGSSSWIQAAVDDCHTWPACQYTERVDVISQLYQIASKAVEVKQYAI